MRRPKLAKAERGQSDAKTMLERFSQPPKQLAEIVPIDDGRPIDRSDEHPANADSPRVEI
jgi:hypothetical protein